MIGSLDPEILTNLGQRREHCINRQRDKGYHHGRKRYEFAKTGRRSAAIFMNQISTPYDPGLN
jgi:hypothetical protein